LTPAGTYTALMTDLQKHARKSRIALVGHEPSIGEIAARLVGSRHAIPFKKGAIGRIDLDEIPPNGPGDLVWFLTPRILRGLKK
jgi:phosphohistidine phosphatase SixA